MADGQTHERFILYATGVTLVGSVLLYDVIKLEYLIAANVGMLSNVFISNDADLEGTSLGELRIAQLLTLFLPNSKFKNFVQDKIIRLVKVWFSVYAIAFPHRSIYSHLPPLCTIIRWLYMLFVYWFMFDRQESFLTLLSWVYNNFYYQVFVFLVFAAIADTIHSTLDSWGLRWTLF